MILFDYYKLVELDYISVLLSLLDSSIYLLLSLTSSVFYLSNSSLNILRSFGSGKNKLFFSKYDNNRLFLDYIIGFIFSLGDISYIFLN